MMNLLARIFSHGFAFVIIALIVIVLMYRGDIFPEWELPEFLVIKSQPGTTAEPSPELADAEGATEAATTTESPLETSASAGQSAEPQTATTVTVEPPADTMSIATERPVEDKETPENAVVPTDLQPVENSSEPAADAAESEVRSESTATESAGSESRPEPATETTGSESRPEPATDAADSESEVSAEPPAAEATGSEAGSEPSATDVAEREASPEPATDATEGEVSAEPRATEATGSESGSEPSATDVAEREASPGPPVTEATGSESSAAVPAVDDTAYPVGAAGIAADKASSAASGPVQAGEPVSTPAAEPALETTADAGAETPYEVMAKAREAFWLRDFDAAEQQYHRLIQLEPENPDGYGELGNMYFSQGKWEEAASAFYEAGTRLLDSGHVLEAQQLVEVIRGLNGPRAEDLETQIKVQSAKSP